MTAVVFNGKNQQVYTVVPSVEEIPKYSVLCVVGPTKQKWYCRADEGWQALSIKNRRKDYKKRLKMLFLLMGKKLPDEEQYRDDLAKYRGSLPNIGAVVRTPFK